MSRAVPLVRELARIEGRRLVIHPASLAGFGIAALGCAIVADGSRSDTRGLTDHGWVIYSAFALLADLVMVAANRIATRDRRYGLTEQHDAVPTTPTRRDAGVLVGLVAPLGVTLVALSLVIAYASSRAPVPGTEVAVLLSVLPLMLTLGALGVAVARWAPSPFVAPALALGLYFWVPSDPQTPWQALMPLNPGDDARTVGWHAVYLLGLAVLFAALAGARSHPRVGAVVGALIGAAVTSAAAVVLVA